jgi:hypothetical protein
VRAIPARGREEKRITLVELPPEERVHILERFPREVRGGTTLRGVSSRRLTDRAPPGVLSAPRPGFRAQSGFDLPRSGHHGS